MATYFLVMITLGVIGFVATYKDEPADDPLPREESPLERRRRQAEQFILASGDRQAIRQLQVAKANPRRYAQALAQGMRNGNGVLRTALGLMAGVAVSQASGDYVVAQRIENSLASLQAGFDAGTAEAHQRAWP